MLSAADTEINAASAFFQPLGRSSFSSEPACINVRFVRVWRAW